MPPFFDWEFPRQSRNMGAQLATSASQIRFGVFEVNLSTRELRKKGHKLRLQEQPFQLLTLLLEKPNEVVTREEIQHKIWGADTFVDFDHGVNRAINKLREALGDSADNPRFIETLSRRWLPFHRTGATGTSAVRQQ
jgi:DNA-binding winged helix-turn-helix (wHTH) protein